jgi:hypothetical protein
MPKDARWRTKSISAELDDELLEFCRKNDKRLPEQPQFSDILRSLARLAKKGLEKGAALQVGTGPHNPSPEPNSLPAAPSIVPPTDAESGTTAEMENGGEMSGSSGASLDGKLQFIQAERELLQEKTRFEISKANTFYWQARSRGRSFPNETTKIIDVPATSSQGQPMQTLSLKLNGRLCGYCNQPIPHPRDPSCPRGSGYNDKGQDGFNES